MQFFNVDGPIFIFLSKMADLFLVNVLFLICSIPIVTIGASTSAMYCVTLKMARNDESYICRSFFTAFKENFKRSTLIFLPALLLFVLMFLNVNILTAPGAPSHPVMLVVAYAVMFILFLLLMFAFPVLARFSGSVSQTLKSAYFMECKHLPFTFIILLITVIPPLLTAMVPLKMGYIYFIWVICGFSLTAFVNSHIFEHMIFKHYVDEETVR